MGLLVKFLFNNIKEKKMRTFLIILSITISTALFFASISLTDTATNIYIKQLQSTFGKSELVIQPNDRSPAQYFNIAIPKEFLSNIAYTIGVVESDALYRYRKDQTVIFNIKGIDWADIQAISPFTLKAETRLMPFSGNKVIISSYVAQKYSLRTGQILELDINQNRYRFFIAAIANPSGLFTANNNLLVVPKTKLSAICSQIGNVSSLYIKLRNPAVKKHFITGLSKSITRYDVNETISEQRLREQTEALTISLNLTLIIVLFLSFFIIFTSFKVITAERLPVIGTFRSIGADKRTTDLILMLESLAYGIIGGVIGCILGIGILFLMAIVIAETPTGGMNQIFISFGILQLGTSFLIATVLSLGSSAIPILQVSRLPVKEIVLNSVQQKELTLKNWKLVAGVGLILIILLVPPVIDGDTAIMLDSLCIGLAIVACIFLIPFITTAFGKILEKIYQCIFGNMGVFAVKNLRGNKHLQNSIVLLAMGIATILMVSIFGRSVVTGLTDFAEQTLNYDLTLVMPRMDRSLILTTRSTKGIKDAYGLNWIQNVKVIGSNERLG
jgi:putative ABC transport system permease protein